MWLEDGTLEVRVGCVVFVVDVVILVFVIFVVVDVVVVRNITTKTSNIIDNSINNTASFQTRTTITITTCLFLLLFCFSLC